MDLSVDNRETNQPTHSKNKSSWTLNANAKYTSTPNNAVKNHSFELAIKSSRSQKVILKGNLNSRQYELMKLDDFEVFISLLKFTLGLGVFNRPYVYKTYGVRNGIISDSVIFVVTAISNYNLVESLSFLPPEMTQPSSNITYGKVVEYLLDDRDVRISRQESASMAESPAGTGSGKKFFKHLLDGFIYYQ